MNHVIWPAPRSGNRNLNGKQYGTWHIRSELNYLTSILQFVIQSGMFDISSLKGFSGLLVYGTYTNTPEKYSPYNMAHIIWNKL